MLDSMLDMEITLNDEFLVQFEKLQSCNIHVVDRIKGGSTVLASLLLCLQMPISPQLRRKRNPSFEITYIIYLKRHLLREGEMERVRRRLAGAHVTLLGPLGQMELSSSSVVSSSP